jgi:dTDP-4-dehydrorhamnose reductase
MDGRAPLQILVLGATGLLGNAMTKVLAHNADFEVVATYRGKSPAAVPGVKFISCPDVTDDALIQELIASVRPAGIVNCVGLVKNLINSPASEVDAFRINATFPHKLANWCKIYNTRLIHFSTDCVFSGKNGFYPDDAIHDATDVYGVSKSLGELIYPHCVTIRSSIVGHCPEHPSGLFDWFISQKYKATTFSNAIYSGLTTLELAKITSTLILPNIEICGVQQIAGMPISKSELLRLVNERYGLALALTPISEPAIDRSLDGSRFCKRTGYVPPTWETMVDQLALFYGIGKNV